MIFEELLEFLGFPECQDAWILKSRRDFRKVPEGRAQAHARSHINAKIFKRNDRNRNLSLIDDLQIRAWGNQLVEPAVAMMPDRESTCIGASIFL